MSVAARSVATAVGFASLMIVYRLLGFDQMASVFKKKELLSKYDYIIGNLLVHLVNNSINIHSLIFRSYFYFSLCSRLKACFHYGCAAMSRYTSMYARHRYISFTIARNAQRSAAVVEMVTKTSRRL